MGKASRLPWGYLLICLLQGNGPKSQSRLRRVATINTVVLTDVVLFFFGPQSVCLCRVVLRFMLSI